MIFVILTQAFDALAPTGIFKLTFSDEILNSSVLSLVIDSMYKKSSACTLEFPKIMIINDINKKKNFTWNLLIFIIEKAII